MAEPQPPEGLRKLFIEVAHGQNCIGCVIGRGRCGGLDEVDEDVADAFLSALFEACEVRLELGASHDSCEHWGIWATEEALSKWLAAREGWRRTWRLIIAEPPVSSTGEEKTGG